MAERREAMLQVRVTAAGVTAVDSLRGDWTRSEYVRQALAQAVKLKLAGPQR